MKRNQTTKLSVPLIAAALAAACSTAFAAEYGTVISSTPVTAQFAVPQQQCHDDQQLVQPRTSGGGALAGALIGGAVGSTLGNGMGHVAATGLALVAGAVLGDKVEAGSTRPETIIVRNCSTVTSYENRVVGYDVSYEYNGQRYTTRLAQDPGPRIALDVNVSPAGGLLAPAPSAFAPPQVVAAPSVVYAPAPVYGYGPTVAVAPSVVIGGYGRHGYWRGPSTAGHKSEPRS